MDQQKPKVGIGIMLFKDGKILMQKREGSHGAGEWAYPGGHLEYMESFEEGARREVREEVGVEIKNIRFQFLSNVKKYAPKHYVHVGLIADWDSGEAKSLEPDKVTEVGWFDLDNLPKPIFEFCIQSLEAYKTGRNYFDS